MSDARRGRERGPHTLLALLATAVVVLVDAARAVREALRFLTRLPLPGPHARRGPGEVLAALPVAGLILGLALALCDGLLGRAGLPFATRDLLGVVAWVVLSGGLHLDGLMDTCDGLFGGWTPERRLEIMRDSRVGSFGVLGAACLLLVKAGLLGALHGNGRLPALVLAPALGRWSMVLAAALFPPARPGGLGAAFRAGVTPPRLVVAGGSALFAAALAGALPGLLALALCGAVTVLVGRYTMSKIPGLTGDTYGAIAEVTEATALLAFALWAGRS